MVGYADPCGLEKNPGWPLRNFLFLIQYYFKCSQVQVMCLRSTIESSIVMDIKLSAVTCI